MWQDPNTPKLLPFFKIPTGDLRFPWLTPLGVRSGVSCEVMRAGVGVYM